jgi:hypothetical protein
VLVDISEESVFSAIEFHPELFKWNGNAVEKTDGSDRLKNGFNSQIPSDIRDQVLRAMED